MDEARLLLSKSEEATAMRTSYASSELVDSLCRDGAETPISLNILNSTELLNSAVISLYRHIIWFMTVSIPDQALKVG